jgi:DNA-binding GntR family transcriptional regulator
MGGRKMALEVTKYFKPVDEESLRDRVAQNIRQLIESGLLKPGTRLVETAIADQMGISRAPVREAIQILEDEGFVTSIPRKGSYVIELERKDIEEIYTLRSALESLAVKLVLPRISDEEINEFEEILEKMHQAAMKRDISGLVEWDHAFHRYLVSLSGNERLLRAWLRMSAQMRVFFAIKDQLYDNPMDIVNTHDPIMEILENRDVERAVAVLSDHIIHAGELVLAQLDEENDDS